MELCSFPSLLVGVSDVLTCFDLSSGSNLVDRWLTATVLAQDRVEDAFRSFWLTQADGESVNEETLQHEFRLLRAQLNHEKHNAVGFIELFKRPSLRKRCAIGWLTMFGAQGTATLVINSKLLP